MMPYDHTQTGWMHYLLYGVGLAMLAMTWALGADPVAQYLLPLVAAVMFLFGASFHRLTVQDEGDYLSVRYGPVPLFGRRFAYKEMTTAEPDRTSIIDGWGIHYIPGRGWTYNLKGFQCVKVSFGKKVVRIGTDEAPALAAFLQGKIEEANRGGV